MLFYAEITFFVTVLRSVISLNNHMSSANHDLLTAFINNAFPTESTFVANTTLSFWNTITTEDLLRIGHSKLQQLQYDDQGIIPDRIKQEINRLLLTNMTMARIKYYLGLDKLPIGYVQQLRRAVSPPELLTSANVTYLGTSILKLGSGFLLRMTKRSAIRTLRGVIYQDYVSATDPLLTEKLKYLLNQLYFKIYGPPGNWTAAMLKNTDLSTFSIDLARQLSPDVVFSYQDAFMNAAESSDDYNLGRIYLKKILQVQNFLNQTNSSKVLNIINNSSNLMYYILPKDVTNPNLLSNPNISAIVNANLLRIASTGHIDPQSSGLILKNFYKMVNKTTGSISLTGRVLIGLTLPDVMKTAARSGSINITDVIPIASVLQNGPGMESKLQTLANIIESSIQHQSNLGQYPNKVIAFLRPSILKKLSGSDARAVLSRDWNAPVADSKTILLLNKIENGFSSLTSKARSFLPNRRIKAMSVFDTSNIAIGLPPVTSAAMSVAEKAFSKKYQIDDHIINRSLAFVPFIGAKEALGLNKSTIMAALFQMKDINPSFLACCALKDILYNYSRDAMGSTSEENTVKLLTVSDIEGMPVCVIACFGANQIANLGTDHKVVLLTRLGLMNDSALSVPRPFRMQIIKDGLSAMRNVTGIQPGDLEVVGNAVADISADLLNVANEKVINDIIYKLNNVIFTKHLKPCLDQDQRAAIGKMVILFKGSNISSWESVADVVCLLSFLSKDNLTAIPAEVLAANSCELEDAIAVINRTEAIFCIASIGFKNYSQMQQDDKQLKELQEQAALAVLAKSQNIGLKRHNSSVTSKTSSICSKAQYTGANGFTNEQLSKLKYDIVIRCLSDFGAKDMELDKAQILANILNGGFGGNLTNLNASFLLDMGYILKGINVSASNYVRLANFTYGTDFDDVIAFLGSQNIFTYAQVRAWASVVKSKWMNASSMSANDLLIVNHLLCGFNASDIHSMNAASVKGAIGRISQLEECPLDPVMKAFADFAKSSLLYGNVSRWNKSDVAELGVLVAGLAPENMNNLNPTSMEGLTPSAMQMMPSDSLKVMDAAHFTYLNPAAGLVISRDQLLVLNPDIHTELKKNLKHFTVLSNAGQRPKPLIGVGICVLLATTRFIVIRP